MRKERAGEKGKRILKGDIEIEIEGGNRKVRYKTKRKGEGRKGTGR